MHNNHHPLLTILKTCLAFHLAEWICGSCGYTLPSTTLYPNPVTISTIALLKNPLPGLKYFSPFPFPG